MYPIKKSTHALFLMITKLGKVRFSIQFLQMFHRIFANGA